LLYAQTIDLTSYERRRDKLREESTLAQVDHHAESIDKLDVQRILAFAECVTARGGPVGPSVPRSEAAAAAAVFPRRDRVRRKSI